jgi:hypothetical protein
VRLHDLARDVEPEPHSARARARHAVELVEDAAVVLARDPLSRVAHLEADRVAGGHRESEREQPEPRPEDKPPQRRIRGQPRQRSHEPERAARDEERRHEDMAQRAGSFIGVLRLEERP